MSKRGFFISFESIDGLGKTTQVNELVKSLRAEGHDIFQTKEPGDANYGSNVGAGVRQLCFVNPTTLKMRPGVADCLFLADHIQTAGDIRQAVDEGKIAITDRYADSQWAYAASENKKCPQWTLDAYQLNYGIVPNLTILLVARGRYVEASDSHTRHKTRIVEDISWVLTRAKSRKGLEAGKQEGKAWNTVEDQRKIQEAYLNALQDQPRTVIVDVWEDTSVATIAATILAQVHYRIALTVSNTLAA